jgi:phage-related minor tail protein
MRPIRTLIALAFFLAFYSVATRAQDQPSTGDPVADAARKAREQKKAAPKPKKFFTDDDVKPAEQPTPPPASSQSTANPDEAKLEKPQGAAQSQAEDENPNSEKAWRKRFAEQHKKISDAELELSVLQRELEKSDIQYYSDPQKAMNEQFTRNEIKEKTSKIEAKKKQVADLKQQLSDMEDQLRASGGDPGWAR